MGYFNFNKNMYSDKNKIILGGGIAGLIKAYFNPGATIISTSKKGGQLNARFDLGPRFIHKDEYTERFFKELCYIPPVKKIKVGFFYDCKVNGAITEEKRKEYFEKTRGISDTPYKSAMSSNKNEFDVYDIENMEFIEIILKKINKTNLFINDTVEKIDTDRKQIVLERDKKIIKYDKLISTIPINTFLRLSGYSNLQDMYKSYPTTFILTIGNPVPGYDYIYVPGKDRKYHRMTQINKNKTVGSNIVLEFRGKDIPEQEGEIDRYVLEIGQLIQNDIKIDIKDVEFFGRYGTWDHSILVNTLLKQEYDR